MIVNLGWQLVGARECSTVYGGLQGCAYACTTHKDFKKFPIDTRSPYLFRLRFVCHTSWPQSLNSYQFWSSLTIPMIFFSHNSW